MRRSQGDALLMWLRSRGKEGVRVLRRFPLPSRVNQKQHSSKIRWKLKEKKKKPTESILKVLYTDSTLCVHCAWKQLD